MPATQARIGYGTEYEVLDTMLSVPVYVEIAELFNLVPPSFTSPKVEATHMQSPGRTREFIPGLIEPGTASFDINFVANSATDQMIRDHQRLGITTTHKITFPDGTTWAYLASFESYAPTVPVDDRMTAAIGINVSGNITEGIGT